MEEVNSTFAVFIFLLGNRHHQIPIVAQRDSFQFFNVVLDPVRADGRDEESQERQQKVDSLGEGPKAAYLFGESAIQITLVPHMDETHG